MPLTLFDQNTQLRHPNRLLVGVDEAGRGPLAGPVTACACHIPPALYGHPVMAQINDSKKITPAKRKKIAAELKMLPITYCLGFASSAEIDAVNILQATFLAMRRALKKFEAKPVFALIDGNKTVPAINCPQQAVIGGDASSLAVAAASILAKVARDDFMDILDKNHPQYFFGEHKGYGTQKHIDAIKLHGPCKWHRKTFEPLHSLFFDLFAAAK